MPGAALELHEREEIHRALVEDPQASWAAIARRVHRSPTTVAREVTELLGQTPSEIPDLTKAATPAMTLLLIAHTPSRRQPRQSPPMQVGNSVAWSPAPLLLDSARSCPPNLRATHQVCNSGWNEPDGGVVLRGNGAVSRASAARGG